MRRSPGADAPEKNRFFLTLRLDKPASAVFIIELTGGRIAQSVEQGTENPCVPSSILGPATIFVVYASPRDWLFCFHPHDPTSKVARIPPFPLSDTAPRPRNRYLSQIFGNGVVSTTIFDTGHNALIINKVIPYRFGHYATRGNADLAGVETASFRFHGNLALEIKGYCAIL